MKLNLAIEALELSLEEIKKTDSLKRIAEANNLAQCLLSAKEELEEGVPAEEVAQTIVEVSERIRNLINFPDSAGKSDLI
jgi:hypothetical protein